MAVIVLFLFLPVSLVGLQCVMVAFLGHTHLLFHIFPDSNRLGIYAISGEIAGC